MEEKAKKDNLHAAVEINNLKKDMDTLKADFSIEKEKIFMEHKTNVEEIKKKNKDGGCTLQYPMFWTAEHAYVAKERFEGHPEAVRILSSGGPLSSFANMRNNNIVETLDLKVE